jgi:hypothetical protein
MNNKRLLIIIGFALAVIAFSVLIYFVFIKDLVSPANTNANANTNTTNINGGGLPNTNATVNVNQGGGTTPTNRLINTTTLKNVNQAQIDQIAQGGQTAAKPTVEVPVLAATTATDGSSVRFYEKNQGKFFVRSKDGTVKELSNQIFPDAKSIVWAPKTNKAIITFPDGSQIIYDFDKQKQTTIPKDWNDVNFSSSGDKIAFKNQSTDASSRWLAVANPDTSEVTLIEPLGDNGDGVAVNWSPNNQVVALYREASTGTTQEVYLIGLHDENFKSITTEGRGFEGIWSPTGSQLLYSVYNADSNFNPTLYLVDASGDSIGANKMSLGLQTWSNKCAFASNNALLYCAVPRTLPDGSGIDPTITGSTNDLIYRINTDTGAQSLVALPNFGSTTRDYTITSPFLDGNDQNLYFTDADSGTLYSVQLK